MSLCLIVKDEEAHLPACLASAADLVDEVIVVDTGSTDRTKEVAASFGARVFDFAWVDSFAAARNESVRHARGDWIFWMDADDRLDEGNRRRLRALFADLTDENAAYAMKCRCLPEPGSSTATVVDHVRLFRNHPELRWQYRVHEQILPAVRRSGGSVRAVDIVIDHVGYQEPRLRNHKHERDLRLLQRDHAEHPQDPFILFNLGWLHENQGRLTEALPLLRQSLGRSQPGDSIVRKLYTLIMECHHRLGQRAEALAVCQHGRRYYPDDAQLLFQEAVLRHEQGDLPGAETCLQRLLATEEGPHFASVAEGLRGHQARHQLGMIYGEQGRLRDAEAQWRAAVEEQPDFRPAWLELGELCLAGGRWDALGEVCAVLETEVGAAVEAATFRARVALARKEFTEARKIVEQAIAQAPRAVAPRVVLSHVLLQEGKDWEAAERALREVLALDPGHQEASHNLAVFLRRQEGAPIKSASPKEEAVPAAEKVPKAGDPS